MKITLSDPSTGDYVKLRTQGLIFMGTGFFIPIQIEELAKLQPIA